MNLTPIRKRMIDNAQSYNKNLSVKVLIAMSDRSILANTHPEDREEFKRELKKQGRL